MKVSIFNSGKEKKKEAHSTGVNEEKARRTMFTQ